MARQLTPEAILCMLNASGGTLLDAGNNDALLDILIISQARGTEVQNLRRHSRAAYGNTAHPYVHVHN